eukprot:6928217-Prymnesium_polylepis.1
MEQLMTYGFEPEHQGRLSIEYDPVLIVTDPNTSSVASLVARWVRNRVVLVGRGRQPAPETTRQTRG